MYSKHIDNPPKYDYPYQEQQRYSGGIVSKPEPTEKKVPKAAKLPASTIKNLEETVEKFAK